MFELDPAFLSTSRGLLALPLCDARLQLDARFAWLVLVPRVDAAAELEDLDAYARRRLMDEILAAGRAVRAVGDALGRPVQKLNVGQLGNVTRQLHVHVVGRRNDDACWPGPAWGQGVAAPYAEAALQRAMDAARAAFSSAAV